MNFKHIFKIAPMIANAKNIYREKDLAGELKKNMGIETRKCFKCFTLNEVFSR